MLNEERLQKCNKQNLLSTIQTSGANRFVRGAHHRRCAREGLTWPMMPQIQPKLQVSGFKGDLGNVRKPSEVRLYTRHLVNPVNP